MAWAWCIFIIVVKCISHCGHGCLKCTNFIYQVQSLWDEHSLTHLRILFICWSAPDWKSFNQLTNNIEKIPTACNEYIILSGSYHQISMSWMKYVILTFLPTLYYTEAFLQVIHVFYLRKSGQTHGWCMVQSGWTSDSIDRKTSIDILCGYIIHYHIYIYIWNNMEPLVSLKLGKSKLHGIPWNCCNWNHRCNRRCETQISMEFNGFSNVEFPHFDYNSICLEFHEILWNFIWTPDICGLTCELNIYSIWSLMISFV